MERNHHAEEINALKNKIHRLTEELAFANNQVQQWRESTLAQELKKRSKELADMTLERDALLDALNSYRIIPNEEQEFRYANEMAQYTRIETDFPEVIDYPGSTVRRSKMAI